MTQDIKEALAQPEQILPSVYSNTHQPEQEPVAWQDRVEWNKKVRDNVDSLLAQAGFQPDSSVRTALGFLNFEAPPQRRWVGLTDEEKKDLCRWWSSPMDAIYATEAKLKERNA